VTIESNNTVTDPVIVNDDVGNNIAGKVKILNTRVRRTNDAEVGTVNVGVVIPQLTHGTVWNTTPLPLKDLTGVVEN
jgi:hypothetical protein